MSKYKVLTNQFISEKPQLGIKKQTEEKQAIFIIEN